MTYLYGQFAGSAVFFIVLLFAMKTLCKNIMSVSNIVHKAVYGSLLAVCLLIAVCTVISLYKQAHVIFI